MFELLTSPPANISQIYLIYHLNTWVNVDFSTKQTCFRKHLFDAALWPNITNVWKIFFVSTGWQIMSKFSGGWSQNLFLTDLWAWVELLWLCWLKYSLSFLLNLEFFVAVSIAVFGKYLRTAGRLDYGNKYKDVFLCEPVKTFISILLQIILYTIK